MPTSPEQERTISDLAPGFPPEGVRIRPNCGPDHDRAVISYPDGSQVVLDIDGEIILDSRPREGYDPACDLLIIERPDGESCLIGPWRSAIGARDLETPEYAAYMRGLVEEWAERILHRPLKVWVLARGETKLREEGK